LANVLARGDGNGTEPVSRRNAVLAQAAIDGRDWNTARRCAEAAIAAGYAPAGLLLAAAAYKSGDVAAALRILEALESPGPAEYALLIRLQLLAGDWRRGWKMLHDCCRAEIFGPPLYDLPRWSGEPLGGRHIVAWGAGQGDDILFARFLPLLAARGASVTVNCRSSMVRLFRSIPGMREVLPLDVTAPAAELQVQTAELPALLQISADEIWPGPYLHARPPHLPGKRCWRVGLVWAADAQHFEAGDRSACLAQMAPLSAITGVQLFSLQLGRPAAEAQPPPSGMHITDLRPGIHDFADTATAIAALDLIISIDTAVANLAGALGARLWVGVPFVPDWRWGRDGRHSAWYPTATVYRQPRPDDWASVFREMARDLAGLAGSEAG
jgi:hypothetical protein